MTLKKKQFLTETLNAKGEYAETHPWRLLYADHLPVQEWTVWYGQTFTDIATKAKRRARDDLRPGSMVFDNVFIVQRWNEDEGIWDDYDDEGEDLTDIVFEEVEA
jgi:hypothetical protein